jgi:UTP--glucose-1-phosphate uridylyltransferase
MAARVRKAVFPVAGFGTRFLPATKAQPKEMLPLVDKPMKSVASGINHIILSRGKSAIEDRLTSAELSVSRVA